MDEYRCPRCHSFSVQRTDQRFAAVTVVEMTCASCKLYEERRSDARDYGEWRERWRGRPQVPIYDYYDDLVDVD
ncbi:MAG TPA: hypothetical protein VHE35_01215 [Kofleriaceae bacterium]|nr:hypothetical protein [Kofleriaceae bacterium]